MDDLTNRHGSCDFYTGMIYNELTQFKTVLDTLNAKGMRIINCLGNEISSHLDFRLEYFSIWKENILFSIDIPVN
jgi:hypothetical protein